jgi:uncharacterized protein (DUF305 family)
MERGIENAMIDAMETVSWNPTRWARGVAALSIVIAGAAVLLSATGAPAQDLPLGTVQTGAPGEPTGDASANVPHTLGAADPDVRFVRGMIPHHEQALEMTALAESRAERADVLALAARIERGQREEIEMMESWLARNAPGGGADAHGHAHGAGHPPGHAADPAGHDPAPEHGMLTRAEMEILEGARGREFDRLFLVYMIRHHEGALEMVADLFAEGGGGTAEMFQLASHIDGDQRIEIARMRRMLSVE